MKKIVNKIDELSFDLRYISDLAGSVPGCIRADLGEVDYTVPPEIIANLKDYSNIYDFKYAPTYGISKLLEAIEVFEIEKLRNFKDGKILVTAGGQAALFAAMSSLLSSGDAILTDKLFYPPYSNLAKITEAKLIPADLDNLDESNPDKNIKLVLLNSPNNPSGKVFSEETLKKIAYLAQKYDWIVIEDAVYSEIFYEERPESITQYCPERSLVINSASKNLCMPGIRIGWIFGELEYVSAIAKLHRNMNSCPNSFFQKIVADYLPISDGFFHNMRNDLRLRKNKITGLLDEIGWKYIKPSGSIYIMTQVPEIDDSVAFVEGLIKNAHISAMPGVYFGDSPDYIRICFGALDDKKLNEFGNRLKLSTNT